MIKSDTMRLYAVLFPHHTTLFYLSKYDQAGVVTALSNATGLESNSGAIYNPQQFISVSRCSEDNDVNKNLTRVLEDSLVG